MNLRPSGYEPDELPDCSTPQQQDANTTDLRKKLQGAKSNKQEISRKTICPQMNTDSHRFTQIKTSILSKHFRILYDKFMTINHHKIRQFSLYH